MKENKILSQLSSIKAYFKTNPTEIIFGLYLLFVFAISVAYTKAKGGAAYFFMLLAIYTVITLTPKIHKWTKKSFFLFFVRNHKKEKMAYFLYFCGN